MSKRYALTAAAKEGAGKGIARALRRENKIPAVIYGDKQPPVGISLTVKDVTLEYHKGHMFTTLCDLTVDGKKHLVLARDVQTHPVSDNVLHVDFLRVNEKTKLNVFVPVEFINHESSPGIFNKGVLNVVRHEVELTCMATAIPDSIEVDLSPFDIGDAIKISNAKLPEGTKPVISNRDFTLATISVPKLMVEEIPVTPAEGAEGEAGAEGAEGEAKAEGGDAAKAEGGDKKADAKGK